MPGGYAAERVKNRCLRPPIGCFLTGNPVQLQNRFNAAFEGAADNAFLLILASATFAFDLNMSAFLQAGGKFAELPEVEAAMPFGARFHLLHSADDLLFRVLVFFIRKAPFSVQSFVNSPIQRQLISVF